jgi:hypothetical protein
MKRKKVCIVTITDLNNYGNRLQNFALVSFLENNFYCNVRTLWPNYTISFLSAGHYLYCQLKDFLMFFLFRQKTVCASRYRRFVRFNRIIKKSRALLLPFGKFFILKNHFEYFISGSDQVWNPDFTLPLNISFLTFAGKKQRLSYAASFGRGSLTMEEIAKISPMVGEMNLLSVREPGSLALIRKMTNGEASLSIDPVFLISSKEWSAFCMRHVSSKAELMVKTPILFVYWLGHENEIVFRRIKEIGEKRLLNVVFCSPNCSMSNVNNFSDCSPWDFVYLLAHASLVVTNSFHGTAFSLIFHRDFYCIQRFDKDAPKNDTRLLALKQEFLIDPSRFDITNDKPADISWGSVDSKIRFEKERSSSLLSRYFQKRV